MNTYPTVDILKKHFPQCSKIFEQIAEKKANEAEYKKLMKNNQQQELKI